MQLIIGLGNPGSQFKGTRHNLGFTVLEYFATQHKAAWHEKTKLHGRVCQIKIERESILLLKPATFYNEVGLSARAAQDFYKISNQNTLVVHDELALPFGVLRSRFNGSDAGNNGIKSLNAHLGSDYARLRIGIQSPLTTTVGDTDFVLGKFSTEEQATVPEIYKKAAHYMEEFIRGTLISTSHTL